MNNTNTETKTINSIRSTKYARGTVWWVDLKGDPMCTTSQTFRRPCLIISNDDYNVKCNKRTIIPMSSKDKYDEWDVAVHTTYEGGDSYILCDQIRQVDIENFLSYMYTVNPKCMIEIEKRLADCYLSAVSTLSNSRPYTSKTSTTVYTDHNDTEFTNKIINKDNVAVTESVNIDNTNVTVAKKDTCIKNYKICNKIKKTEINYKTMSQMPIGFYSKIENNVAWWNDYLNHGQDYVMKKYNLDTVIRFQKRKYEVKKKLISNNYDLSKPIKI